MPVPPRPRTTPYVPLHARGGQGEGRPIWLHGARAGLDDGAHPASNAPSILLIDAIERRIRGLGCDPVRTFDSQRRWRLEAAGEVIAEGGSLDELARAAHAWLEARQGRR